MNTCVRMLPELITGSGGNGFAALKIGWSIDGGLDSNIRKLGTTRESTFSQYLLEPTYLIDITCWVGGLGGEDCLRAGTCCLYKDGNRLMRITLCSGVYRSEVFIMCDVRMTHAYMRHNTQCVLTIPNQVMLRVVNIWADVQHVHVQRPGFPSTSGAALVND